MPILNPTKKDFLRYPENPVCEPLFPVLYGRGVLFRGFRPLTPSAFHVPVETTDEDLRDFLEDVEYNLGSSEIAERTADAIAEYFQFSAGFSFKFEPDLFGVGPEIVSSMNEAHIAIWVAASECERQARMKTLMHGAPDETGKYFLFASEMVERLQREIPEPVLQ